MELRKTFGRFVDGGALTPKGWLRRQLQLQADGQAGNLDKFWPDVKDSAWIGGKAEGWERVPYWLDGFIDLAWLLDDDDMKARAKRYIDAIFANQCADGWICPCPVEKRADYDMWSLFLLAKVLHVWHRRTGDPRVAPALMEAFRQLRSHLAANPLKNWGKYRWYEGLGALAWLFEETKEPWLLVLAERIRQQSYDYPSLAANWPYTSKAKKWTFEEHVVNLGMVLHSELFYQRLHPESNTDGEAFAETILANLMKYHSMATGMFTGDECVSGDSPSQGTELCAVVEAMYSEELLLAATGHPVWGDRLEKLAFNALPAACSADMWTHQYDHATNQIGCQKEPTPIWSTNGPEAHLFGLEPNYGCCTANHGQGWPKLAASAFLLGDRSIISALMLPCRLETEIDGAQIVCDVETDYPFRDTATYTITVSQPVTFDLKIRIPGFAKAAEIDGKPVKTGAFHVISKTWEGKTELKVKPTFEPQFVERPRGMSVLWRGPLLFSLPIPSRSEKHEYVRDGVERKFPYCDYEYFATAPWNYGFAGQPVGVEEHPLPDMPFAEDHPPITITIPMARIPWAIHEKSLAIAAPQPSSLTPEGPAEQKTLIPFGSTMLRMTEMPIVKAD